MKAPVGVWFSCLTQSSAPTRRDSSGQQYCGVGGTTEWTNSAAASRIASSLPFPGRMAYGLQKIERKAMKIA